MKATGIALVGLLILLSFPVSGQRRRDPLNPAEIDQLRDAMVEPLERLKLYVAFARVRLDSLEQMRRDPKTEGRGQKTHDMLGDFLAVYDELNENIDMYVDRKEDIRKPLKVVIEADTEFQSRVRAIKDAAGVPVAEGKQYEFVITNALDTLDSSADDHRKLMVEQEELAKTKKKKKRND
jgi:hypothetical protein